MMGKSEKKLVKFFFGFVVICIIALPFIVLSAFSFEPKEFESAVIESKVDGFDQNGKAIFDNYDRMPSDYIEGTSTERTLNEYYSRREYSGSPPFIPHKIEEEDGTKIACLTCHATGGWTAELKRNTPLTPHPEQSYCSQCHIKMTAEDLFVENNWMSIPPPRLGRSHLPGGPPPIPHALQMRGNCIACHVGPGAVVAIRVEHPMRGNCRQCHVPDTFTGLFERKSDY